MSAKNIVKPKFNEGDSKFGGQKKDEYSRSRELSTSKTANYSRLDTVPVTKTPQPQIQFWLMSQLFDGNSSIVTSSTF